MAPRVLIVGAGFGGVAAAIELQRHGVTDITILDKAPEAGGTWFWNTYPGAACDVPSHFYSFSYDQRPTGQRLCPLQEEILVYLRDVVRKHGIERLITHGVTVTDCAWDDDTRAAGRSRRDDARSFEGDVLILATGQLHQPRYPRHPGRRHASPATPSTRRAGTTTTTCAASASRSSARARAPCSSCRRSPAVAKQLTVFQRTGNWFLPRKNRPYPSVWKTLVKRVPGLQAWRRKYMFYYCESLTLSIRHPRTLGRLLGLRSAASCACSSRTRRCARRCGPTTRSAASASCSARDFLPALQRPNVELVTERITRCARAGS